ncbi:hypothetical protein 3 [Sanxia tombus-like virus 1]|uniref:hypothetical protein 3 n=1 Tax=Sanxia tombus-like virus 1 TaxID=1923385 RepID=UPI00090CC2AC|nr:hypothetical protein 3 [Sanxia tombus-like virus 1]APG76444.1 hypothetical protein 3 [Sanxia tombus-like virus 1]APG76538.1 hypothetical protein 1 [Sanxia tombus-like virus 1]
MCRCKKRLLLRKMNGSSKSRVVHATLLARQLLQKQQVTLINITTGRVLVILRLTGWFLGTLFARLSKSSKFRSGALTCVVLWIRPSMRSCTFHGIICIALRLGVVVNKWKDSRLRSRLDSQIFRDSHSNWPNQLAVSPYAVGWDSWLAAC